MHESAYDNRTHRVTIEIKPQFISAKEAFNICEVWSHKINPSKVFNGSSHKIIKSESVSNNIVY